MSSSLGPGIAIEDSVSMSVKEGSSAGAACDEAHLLRHCEPDCLASWEKGICLIDRDTSRKLAILSEPEPERLLLLVDKTKLCARRNVVVLNEAHEARRASHENFPGPGARPNQSTTHPAPPGKRTAPHLAIPCKPTRSAQKSTNPSSCQAISRTKCYQKCTIMEATNYKHIIISTPFTAIEVIRIPSKATLTLPHMFAELQHLIRHLSLGL